MDSPAGVFILVAILLAAVVGVIYLAVASKSSSRLHVQKYQASWLAIENGVSRDNAASWQLAILNADKLLDQALRERRFRGKTMGERMKSANKVWRNIDHVWGAHKIRNRLAHETDMTVDYNTTLRTLSAFKQALKDLGAI